MSLSLFILLPLALVEINLSLSLSEQKNDFFVGRFEGIDKDIPVVRFSSKKLIGMGFSYKYTLEDMFTGAIETCRAKGLLPYSTKIHTNGELETRGRPLNPLEKHTDIQEKELHPASEEKHAEGKQSGLLSDSYATQIHTNGEEKEVLLNSLEKDPDGQEKDLLTTSNEKRIEVKETDLIPTSKGKHAEEREHHLVPTSEEKHAGEQENDPLSDSAK